ncbi:MAG: glycosyltransferase family 39 protein [Saprospiraceae bacterium]
MQNQWNIRNFYRYDNNILNPRIPAHNLGHDDNILRYEFPLMQWIIAQLERLFGENILVTRMTMFLVGCLALLGFYFLSKQIFEDELLASCGAWIMSLAPVFYYYTLNPMSDIWAMTGQIWMMAFAVQYYRQNQFRHFIWSAGMLCLAGLCKLPYIIFGIIPFLIAIREYVNHGKSNALLLRSIFTLMIFSLPVALWYIYAIRSWQSMGVLSGVFGVLDVTELKSYFINTIDRWLPGELINPVIFLVFILGLISLPISLRNMSGLYRILAIGGILVILFYLYEVNMIARIHDYYMLPFLVFLHLVILRGLSLLWKHQMTRYISVLCLAIMPGLVYPYVNREYWSIDRNSYNVDWFYHSKELTDAVPRDSICIILNDNTGTVKPYTIDKQGYVLDKDELPKGWMDDMILHRRASFLYSDSRKVDTNQIILPYLDQLVMQIGSIRVYKLISIQELQSKNR